MVLTLCALVLAAGPVDADAPSSPALPVVVQPATDDPYSPTVILPVVEGLAGVVGGYLGALIATFPSLLINEGRARDAYSLTAWSVATPLATAFGVYLAAGLDRHRQRSFLWALTGAVGGEAIAAGIFFGVGGADRVRDAQGVGPAFWPLVLAPILSAVGATVLVELTSKTEPSTQLAFEPLVVPLREGVARGVQLSARF
jgi:hypothetical protein